MEQFRLDLRVHRSLRKLGIEKMREEWQDPTIYEEFERLPRLVDDMFRERGIPVPTPEAMRQVLKEEAVRGEEPRTTTTE